MIASITMLFWLVFAHFLADFPLQGDFLAKAKNRFAPIDGVSPIWCLFAHCAIHAGMVWFITESPFLAVVEFSFHAIIDDWKCGRKISFNQDQVLHLLCKLGYVLGLSV